MTDDQHYDVVIIGTGAGGGTLGHRLATQRQARCSGSNAAPFLPRELDNWETQAVFVRGKYLAPESVVRRARPRVPARGQLLRRREHQVLRRGAVPAAARGLRRDHATTAASRPPGRSPTTTSSPTTPRPSTSTSCTASTARTRREGPASAQYALPAGVPRAPDPAAERRPGEGSGCTRSTCRSESTSRRTEPGRPARASACIRCDRVDGFPCLLDAKSDAQVICVDPALAHDNVTLVTEADVQRLETDADRAHGHRGRHRAGRRSRRHVHRRRRGGGLRGGELGRPAAAVGQRHATRTGSPTAREWSGGTTCGTTTSP